MEEEGGPFPSGGGLGAPGPGCCEAGPPHTQNGQVPEQSRPPQSGPGGRAGSWGFTRRWAQPGTDVAERLKGKIGEGRWLPPDLRSILTHHACRHVLPARVKGPSILNHEWPWSGEQCEAAPSQAPQDPWPWDTPSGESTPSRLLHPLQPCFPAPAQAAHRTSRAAPSPGGTGAPRAAWTRRLRPGFLQNAPADLEPGPLAADAAAAAIRANPVLSLMRCCVCGGPRWDRSPGLPAHPSLPGLVASLHFPALFPGLRSPLCVPPPQGQWTDLRGTCSALRGTL